MKRINLFLAALLLAIMPIITPYAFADTDTYDLQIKLRVEGNVASKIHSFAVTVKIENIDTNQSYPLTAPETYKLIDGLREEDFKEERKFLTGQELKDGAVVYLKHDEHIIISNLPKGLHYTVTVDPKDYTAKDMEGCVNSGVIGEVPSQNGVISVGFVNSRDGIVPTGIMMTVIPGALLLMAGSAALVSMLSKNANTSQEDPHQDEPQGKLSNSVNPLLHGYIQQVNEQVKKFKTILDTFEKTVDRKFQPGTLTNSKFSDGAQKAIDVFNGNIDKLNEYCENFDVKAYNRTKELIESKAYKKDYINDDIQLLEYQLIQKQIQRMQDIINANQQIIVSVANLTNGLRTLDDAENNAETENTLKTMQDLLDSVKYYANN